MFLDFVIAYIAVAVFMGVCTWRSSARAFPIQSAKEWAALGAASLVWPYVWWADGYDL
jgi:hypothetical protein